MKISFSHESLPYTDNADNETGFRLYDDSGNIIATAGANASYFEEGNLRPNTSYVRYVKAYNAYGESIASQSVSATTHNNAVIVIYPQPEQQTQETQQPIQFQTNLPTVTFDKPISQMTREEILAKITEITQAIEQIKSLMPNTQANTGQPPNIPSSFQFQSNLKKGMSNIQVKYLQMILNQDKDTQLTETGIGSPGNETSYFGSLTEQAVIKFQEKYKNSILSPWNLSNGTGLVGKTTRDKLNEFISE